MTIVLLAWALIMVLVFIVIPAFTFRCSVTRFADQYRRTFDKPDLRDIARED